MWLNKTEHEIAGEKRNRRLARAALAIVSWLALLVFVTSSPGWQPRWPGHGVWPRLLPSAAAWNFAAGAFALGAALLLRRLRKRDLSVMICEGCQRLKLADGDRRCSCGGMFRPLNEMKWVDGPHNGNPMPRGT
jgi:hypothetical protein